MSGSATTVADILALVPADDRVDLTGPDGAMITVIRVGLATVRSMGDGTADAHDHDSMEEAQACFAHNVNQAEAVAANDPQAWASSAQAQLDGLLGVPVTVGMYL